MFSGLTSRWTMPAACAAASARATWRPISTVAPNGCCLLDHRPQRAAVDQLLHDEVARRSGVSPTSWIVTMLGWLRAEAARASRRNRWTTDGVLAPAVAHQFDGDRAVQPGVERAVNVAHAARADAVINAVVPESGRCHGDVAEAAPRAIYIPIAPHREYQSCRRIIPHHHYGCDHPGRANSVCSISGATGRR